jgi:predicted transcriptional regulator
MSDTKKESTSRGMILKRLRETHAKSVKRTQALLRDQRQMQQAIHKSIGDTPKTVPEIAAEIGKPSHEVLWFVSALKKYGMVIEAGMRSDYPLYQWAKEARA